MPTRFDETTDRSTGLGTQSAGAHTISTHDEVDLVLQVARRTAAADGVVTFELRDPDGADLPWWAAGAHIDVHLPGNLTRQYSLCGSADDRSRWRIGVLREPAGRGGSAHLHDEIATGAQLSVRGPRNHFPMVPAERYLFVAGGIGITPILPMIAAAQRDGSDWELHYGGRTRASMAFLSELDQLDGGRVTIYPQDQVGLIDLALLLDAPRPDTAVYCCGPEPLLAAVEARCRPWPSGSLHVERFAPRPMAAAAGSAFQVELAASGLTVTIPVGRSILEAVEDAGVAVLSSCREGTCGTCETAVLAGHVEHRDSLLTDEEQAADDTMFICVSRAAGPGLVLDL